VINPKLLGEKKAIDNLFQVIFGFNGDDYIKSLLTYYLCIRVSGFLENSIRIIFTDYSVPRTLDNVRTYINNKLEKFPNPTWDSIASLTGTFSEQWKKDIRAGVSQKQRTSLESINLNRNAIAHGGISTIAINDLLTYYNDVVLLIEEIERVCV